MNGTIRGGRSPGYPYIDIEIALDRVEQTWDYAKQNDADLVGLYQTWGFSGATGSSKKNLAALKYFGLLEIIGKGDNQTAKLTSRAKEIHFHEDGSAEWRKHVQGAFLSPKMYVYCWQKWGKDLPVDNLILRHLILEKGFNDATVGSFLKSYKHSLNYSGLLDSGIVSDEEDEHAADAEEEKHFVGSIQTKLPSIQTIATGDFTPPKQETTSVKQEVSVLEEGQVVIQWPAKMSSASFEDFTDWLQLLHRKIGRTVEGDKKPKLELKTHEGKEEV